MSKPFVNLIFCLPPYERDILSFQIKELAKTVRDYTDNKNVLGEKNVSVKSIHHHQLIQLLHQTITNLGQSATREQILVLFSVDEAIRPEAISLITEFYNRSKATIIIYYDEMSSTSEDHLKKINAQLTRIQEPVNQTVIKEYLNDLRDYLSLLLSPLSKEDSSKIPTEHALPAVPETPHETSSFGVSIPTYTTETWRGRMGEDTSISEPTPDEMLGNIVLKPKQSNVPESLKPYLSDVLFRYSPLPKTDGDKWWYPENDQQALAGVKVEKGPNWVMAGASRRGYSHWNSQSPRDDAFKLGTAGLWNIVAMADGAGTAHMSRVTANRSVQIAVDEASKFAPLMPSDRATTQRKIEDAMRSAIRRVYQFQETFTQDEHLTKRDTYTTFMLLIHQPFPDGSCVFGVIHIGDGYMLCANDDKCRPITQGDHGTVSNEAYFLLSFSEKQILDRVTSHYVEEPIDLFLIVTDGIEDDLKPNSKQYEQGITKHDRFRDYTNVLRRENLIWPKWQEWGEILDWMLIYERKGSYDDRSIAVLTLEPDTTRR